LHADYFGQKEQEEAEELSFSLRLFFGLPLSYMKQSHHNLLEGRMVQPLLFRDRHEAGQQLAQAVIAELSTLSDSQRLAPPVIYGLPRGGIPVAEPLAQLLHCPLDVVVAKKITRLDNPELAIGAVTADGQVIRSRYENLAGQDPRVWRMAVERAQQKARGQLAQLSPHCPQTNPRGAIAILIDDGIATGMTIAVAARAIRAKQPAALFICAPVAPKLMIERLENWCDRVIVLIAPEAFLSVSRFYADFPQVEMAEVIAGLERQNAVKHPNPD